MRQYNSLHFTVLDPKNRPSKPDLFLANIVQLYPTLQVALNAKLATIDINGESLFLACTSSHSSPFYFGYTIYWAVASLSSVRKLVDDLKRLAIRANLVCVQLPAELLRPFDNAISPLFYSREIVVSHDSNMDYFCHLMDMLLYRVNECEGGYVKRECVYENGVKQRVIREFTDDGLMIEYDDNGEIVYEGGFEGDMMNGFIREEKGSEYGSDGKSVLYVGGWKNGLREGYGSEFKGYSPVYIGEWKNGLRDGAGKELNENEEVIRRGRWNKGTYGVIKRFEDGYGNDLSVFDVDCLKEIERVEIGNDCFEKVNRFVIDGLNELKSMKIGKNSFNFYDTRCGSNCVIMNCDQLSEIHIGFQSFCWYESFELKNLPSLISIQLDGYAFKNCHLIVFESMND